MTDLSQQITDHLKQCDRIDDSEILLELAQEQIDRLNHEMEATKEAARAREAVLRAGLEDISDARRVMTYGDPGVLREHAASTLDRTALNGEAGE
ncbi:hypothetical protein [Leisingera sp. ANG-M7]|uniref:hypothetical protein n=1 Tax=Leisingera sp. ANG-M7 TaxID=1577902 RepID=UPI00057E7BF6|nr:hypothetical protein [Leisingera sp. ANG-M7]KIC39374.1 hypothetical protein RA26_01610 [Leisingera sp. ANG-M7]